MNKKQKHTVVGIVLVWFLGLMIYYLHQANIQILNPKGVIALKERNLMIITVLLGMLVIVPVYIMTFFIAWKYRESNKKATYNPDWDHNLLVEAVWWGIPATIILLLSVITWNTSHALDPHKLLSKQPPMKIQVVALDWKWLFIYPDQGIASVNYVQFPVDRPVQFEITSDGPMNSFWIPQLGSQIYAMAGMSTHLNLEATSPGDYRGSSANISGQGFAGMKFIARASSNQEFDAWVNGVKSTTTKLDMPAFKSLARPSENNPPATYAATEPGLYNQVLAQFQLPGGGE